MSQGCFTRKPHGREGGACNAWQRWAARRAGCDVPYGVLREWQGAAQPEVWGSEQAGSLCHCLPEDTQRGSAVTGAFTVPTSGGFMRAWQRSGTGSHILASEDSSTSALWPTQRGPSRTPRPTAHRPAPCSSPPPRWARRWDRSVGCAG